MADARQRYEGGIDDLSAGSPSSVSDETDPAGVVLEPRVVQARVTQVDRYRIASGWIVPQTIAPIWMADGRTLHTRGNVRKSAHDPGE
jgi:hypothetical protein